MLMYTKWYYWILWSGIAREYDIVNILSRYFERIWYCEHCDHLSTLNNQVNPMAAVPSSYLVNHHQHFYIASLGYHWEGMRISPKEHQHFYIASLGYHQKGFLPFSMRIDDLAQHLNICPLGLVALQQLTYRMQGVWVGGSSYWSSMWHTGVCNKSIECLDDSKPQA